LSTARWQTRGFNQSEELARRLAYDLALPCVSGMLQRGRDTPAQAGLNRADRLENLRGAFTVHRPVTGQFIALIDDVSTTGATLAEAAQTLKQQGAARVEGWVLLRTPDNRA
jgi:ComF family protein